VTDERPRLPRLDNFASFEAVPGAGRPRRRAMWSIHPLRAETLASAEAARFTSIEAELLAGLGRRKPE
jgi:hypothetical protein